MGYVYPTWLPWGGARFPNAAYFNPPLVDDIGVDIVECIDLLCCMAGLGVQRHQHKLLHLCWTADHQPLAWVQPLSREWEPQETTPGQAPATGQEKLKGKGEFGALLVPQTGNSSGELHALVHCSGFAAFFPLAFPGQYGFGQEVG